MDSDLLLFLSSLNTNYNWIGPILENYNTLDDIVYDNAKKLLEVDPKIYEFIFKNIKKFDINLYKEKLWKNSIKLLHMVIQNIRKNYLKLMMLHILYITKEI